LPEYEGYIRKVVLDDVAGTFHGEVINESPEV
jgi:hypothetical protein